MISPVSSQSQAYVQNTQAAKPQAASTAASHSSQAPNTEDKVELSAQAKAALAGGDADHDGDSH